MTRDLTPDVGREAPDWTWPTPPRAPRHPSAQRPCAQRLGSAAMRKATRGGRKGRPCAQRMTRPIAPGAARPDGPVMRQATRAAGDRPAHARGGSDGRRWRAMAGPDGPVMRQATRGGRKGRSGGRNPRSGGRNPRAPGDSGGRNPRAAGDPASRGRLGGAGLARLWHAASRADWCDSHPQTSRKRLISHGGHDVRMAVRKPADPPRPHGSHPR